MLTILLDSWFDHSIVSTTATMTKEKHVVSNNYDFARILNLFSFLKTQPRAFCLQHKHKSNSTGARKHHISRIHTKHALNRRIYLVKYFITGCKIKSESFQFPLPHKH